MSYRLYAVRVFCIDWEASVRFYGETLGLPEKFSDAAMGWAEFDVGGASLAIERVVRVERVEGDERVAGTDPEAASLVGRFLGISLEVADIQAEYLRLLGCAVEFLGPPARQPWGGVLAHFLDPAGNTLTLLGKADPTSEEVDSS